VAVQALIINDLKAKAPTEAHKAVDALKPTGQRSETAHKGRLGGRVTQRRVSENGSSRDLRSKRQAEYLEAVATE
jgi:hypothetical protein